MCPIKYKPYPHTNKIKNHTIADYTVGLPRSTGSFSGLNTN